MTESRRLPTSVFLLLSLVAFAPSASAQVGSTTGAINGTVIDNTKAVLPGVTVTVSGSAMMGKRTVVTGADGAYRTPTVPPGDYTLVFELAGFATLTREGIRVGVGFTATVNAEMNPAGVAETLTVSGAAPVVDVVGGKVAVNFDAARIATVLGARDYYGMLPLLPGVTVSRVDVGGLGQLSVQSYRAYGIQGQGRGEIEGMVSNPPSNNDLNNPDINSLEEMAVNVAGNSAEMPLPGMLTTLISKSGGNAFRGGLYTDYQTDKLEAHNIDASQLALGVTGGARLAATDTNRMVNLRNLNADLGGYFIKDKLWWFGAYMYTSLTQGNVNLIDSVQKTTANPGYTGKLTYNLSQKSKLIAYGTRTVKNQDNYFNTYNLGASKFTAATLPIEWFPTGVWKVEYNAVLSDRAVLEVRGGDWFYNFVSTPKSESLRYEDAGNGFVIGSPPYSNEDLHRRQANGSFSYFKQGWAGTHNLKFGGEVMQDASVRLWSAFDNLVLRLNNGAPSQVYFYHSPVRSLNNLWTASGYASDTWRMTPRLTFNLGFRLDRYRPYVPAQAGPTGQQFDRIDGPLWYNWGPRFGVNYDLSGDGKTLVKVNYGQFWENPKVYFAQVFNPNPSSNFEAYTWTPANPTYVDGLPVFVPGQEGQLVSRAGARADGKPSTTFDPNVRNVYSRQVTVFVEREIAANFGVRTGFVWNGRRQAWGPVNVSQPFGAFDVPTLVVDPGPDGRAGTSDDGASVQAFGLNAALVGQPVVNVLRNLPDAKADHYTWEVTANKRPIGRWSLLASFSYTWNRESPFPLDSTSLVAYTPNALIGTVGGRDVYGGWVAKVTGTLNLPWRVVVTPVFRSQSGAVFARTFLAKLNYNSAVAIRAQRLGVDHCPTVYVADVRAERRIVLTRMKFGLFFDVYNIFNANPTMAVNASSGSAFLRPTAIMAPRVARIGARFTF
jgi:outer membrane receptor protein involved in Fe transport